MTPRDLPDRIVVGANGAYWRDYGTHYSMCPVSEDNEPVVVAATYVRDYLDPALDAAPQASLALDVLRSLLTQYLVKWKRLDQPDKPLATVERWAEWFIDAALAPQAPDHGHEWVDVRNYVVTSGEVCHVCGATRAAPQTPEGERL